MQIQHDLTKINVKKIVYMYGGIPAQAVCKLVLQVEDRRFESRRGQQISDYFYITGRNAVCKFS